MSARTHQGVPPAPPIAPGTRLPWWAAALPVLVFTALLALMATGPGAPAARGDAEVGRVLQRIQQTLTP
ncbi:hypothetical protein [Streptomyces sp. NPDC047097]|uniref:hypothetical protein n=1 Tax=Streptomyces sp. NPDC047097 TaxID=3155260 RepID=UPI0033FB3BC0